MSDLEPTTEARLAEIRKRTENAAPGPWHWAGNTDVRHVYLANWQPGRGRCSVMDFARWGMNSAKPQFVTDHLYVDDMNAMAVFEVAPSATSRDDKRVYRADIKGLRHPDAEFIANSRGDVEFLLDTVDHLRHVIDALTAEREQQAGPVMPHPRVIKDHATVMWTVEFQCADGTWWSLSGGWDLPSLEDAEKVRAEQQPHRPGEAWRIVKVTRAGRAEIVSTGDAL